MRRNLRGCFKEEASKVHNNKYGYDKVNYITNKIPVIITCPIHGDFKQQPETILMVRDVHCVGKRTGAIEEGGVKLNQNPYTIKEYVTYLAKIVMESH